MTRPQEILLVEDDENVARVLAKVLTLGGFAVTTETEADAAITRIAAEPLRYDALLVDVHLKDMDGRVLAARARGAAPRAKALFMTGDESIRVPAEAGRVLVKPFAPAQLFDALAKLLASPQ